MIHIGFDTWFSLSNFLAFWTSGFHLIGNFSTFCTMIRGVTLVVFLPYRLVNPLLPTSGFSLVMPVIGILISSCSK